MVHGAGGLVYLDGANMNAILGVTRPGDFGADMMHYNPHKTFSGPHGGGGPGAGPIAVTAKLAPYLPVPLVEKDGDLYQPRVQPPEIDRSGTQLLRQYGRAGTDLLLPSDARAGGPAARVAKTPCSTPTTCCSRVKHFLPVPQGDRCMHEFVATAQKLKSERGVSAMDIGKRLLDYGFHAPTVYFPLIVREALMVEPTESESRSTLDAFAEALFRITEEDPELLHDAPHSTAVSRPDEVRARRQAIQVVRIRGVEWFRSVNESDSDGGRTLRFRGSLLLAMQRSRCPCRAEFAC